MPQLALSLPDGPLRPTALPRLQHRFPVTRGDGVDLAKPWQRRSSCPVQADQDGCTPLIRPSWSTLQITDVVAITSDLNRSSLRRRRSAA